MDDKRRAVDDPGSGAEGGGRVDLDPLVVGAIVRDAALQVAGVAELASTLPQKVKGALRQAVPGVTVVVDEEGGLRIHVHIAVPYGVALSEVGRGLKRQVVSKVEAITGLKVTDIAVHVDRVVSDVS